MLAWLESLPWLPLSVTGLLGTGVLALIRGTLVPSSTLDGRERDWKDRLEDKSREAEDWKHAYLASEKARTQTDQQLGHLLELYRSTDLYIRSRTRNGGQD